MNHALSLLERGNKEQARKTLRSMSTDGFREVSEDFWYPVMWCKRKQPEGALVCLLAQYAGAAAFPEFDEMLKAVMDQIPLWIDLL